MFPSRLGLGSGSAAGSGDKVLQQQMKEITNIFRRVYRIFAHAWFQHRDMFWRVEGKTGLFVMFKTVCDEYGMIQAENYTIPPEAEGLEPEVKEEVGVQQAPRLLERDESADHTIIQRGLDAQQEPAGNHTLAAGDTTKRHRHTVSDRASSVTTIIQEEAEEDDEEAEQSVLDLQPPSSTAVPSEEHEEQSDAVENADEDEPVPGILRSDTLKPSKEAEMLDDEHNDTIVESRTGGGDDAAAHVEPVHQSEGSMEGEDAANSVAD